MEPPDDLDLPSPQDVARMEAILSDLTKGLIWNPDRNPNVLWFRDIIARPTHRLSMDELSNWNVLTALIPDWEERGWLPQKFCPWWDDPRKVVTFEADARGTSLCDAYLASMDLKQIPPDQFLLPHVGVVRIMIRDFAPESLNLILRSSFTGAQSLSQVLHGEHLLSHLSDEFISSEWGCVQPELLREVALADPDAHFSDIAAAVQ